MPPALSTQLRHLHFLRRRLLRLRFLNRPYQIPCPKPLSPATPRNRQVSSSSPPILTFRRQSSFPRRRSNIYGVFVMPPTLSHFAPSFLGPPTNASRRLLASIHNSSCQCQGKAKEQRSTSYSGPSRHPLHLQCYSPIWQNSN